MSSPNLQGHGREGTQRAILSETTSTGQGGRHFGCGAGQLGVPRTATLQPRQCFEGDIPELHGKTYELVSNKATDLYTETTKHIASYIAQKCQQRGDIRRVMETRAHPTITAPNQMMIATQLGIPEPTLMGDREMARTVVDPLVQMMFVEEVKEHVKHTRKLDKNIKFLWMVLWAQSSQAV